MLDRLLEQVEHPVEIVGSPVVDGAATDVLVGVPEVAWMRERSDERLVVERLTDRASAHEPLQRQVVSVPAAVLIDRQHPVCRISCVDHLVGLGRREAERFLDDDVLAGGDRPQRPLGVTARRRRDDDEIDVIAREQLLAIGERQYVGRERARRVDPGRVLVAHRGQDQTVDSGDRLVVLVPDRAVAQNTDTDVRSLDQTEGMAQPTLHQQPVAAVGQGRRGRAGGEHANAGRRTPRHHGMRGEP